MAKIGFIGMGNMGTAIMRGLLKTYKPEELLFTSAHEAKMQKITEETGVAHVSTATDCAEQVKYLVLAVKPQVLPTVFKELNGKIRKDQVVISIAAGYAIADLQAGLGDSARIVRSMPNTPAMVGEGMSGVSYDEALFTDEELLRNYDFYQTVTLHHSSLSTCIFGILASRIGRHEDAYTYFAQSARMDLDDYHDNFYAGIHAANMAGTWQSIVFGFAGLRLVNGVPEFKFYIPEAWNGYHFTVKIKRSVLAVDVLPDGWTITLQSGDAVNFLVEGKPYKLTEKGATCHEAL